MAVKIKYTRDVTHPKALAGKAGDTWKRREADAKRLVDEGYAKYVKEPEPPEEPSDHDELIDEGSDAGDGRSPD